MAVAYVDHTIEKSSTLGSSNIVFEHVVPAGDNRLLLVIFTQKYGQAPYSSVTYDGNACTALGHADTYPQTYSYYRALGSGSEITADIVLDRGSEDPYYAVVAVNLTGVDQEDPIGADETATVTQNSCTVNITTDTADSMLFGGGSGYGENSDPWSQLDGQTERWDEDTGGPSTTDDDVGFWGSQLAAATAQQYSFGVDSARDYYQSMVVAEIHAAAGGGTTHEAAASVSGVGSISADGVLTLGAAGTASGAGSTAGTAALTLAAAAAVAGAGSVSADAVLTLGAAGSVAGAGSVSADAVLTVVGAASVAGAGTTAAVAVLTLVGAASVAGAGTATGTADVTAELEGAAVASGAGTATGTGVMTFVGAASVAGAGSVSTTATVTEAEEAAEPGQSFAPKQICFMADTVEGLRDELNHVFAKIAERFETDLVVTKSVQFIPVRGPLYKGDAAMGTMFVRQYEYDTPQAGMVLMVLPHSTYTKFLATMDSGTAGKDADGETLLGGLHDD